MKMFDKEQKIVANSVINKLNTGVFVCLVSSFVIYPNLMRYWVIFFLWKKVYYRGMIFGDTTGRRIAFVSR